MGIRDDDAWARRRRREREDAEAQAATKEQKSKRPGAPVQVSRDDLPQLLTTAEQLIDQVEALYKQFILGLTERPPHEKRRQLEKILESIFKAPRTNPALQFRIGSLNAHFLTHRDKWDRQLKELETGKIKRVVAPKRKTGPRS